MTTKEGAGTRMRWAPLAANSRARPAVAAFKLINGGTTTDWTGSETEKADPKDFETASSGWADGKVVENSWAMSFSVNKKKSDAAQAAQLYAIRDAWASRAEIWFETIEVDDTNWEGGVVSVKGPKFTRPADNAISFACTLTGRGAPVYTPDA